MSSYKSQVKNTYNLIAPEFSASRRYLWPEIKPYLDCLPENASVLDLGCGNGRLLTAIDKPINYVGVDFSTSLIKEARKIHPGSKFIIGDISNASIYKLLPQFDAIFCLAVLHHLPTHQNHQFVIDQIKKHLKPDGFAVISVWNLWQPRFLKYHLHSLGLKLTNWHYLNIPFDGHDRFHYAFTARELASLAPSGSLDSSSNRNLVLVLS